MSKLVGSTSDTSAKSPVRQNPHRNPGVGFLDGTFVPIDQVRIPVLDQGFLHSDATYDVVHVWNNAFFRLDDHLDRFMNGMQKLHMSIDLDRTSIKKILARCVMESGLSDAYVEMICTRGMPDSNTRDPRRCINQFYAFAVPFAWIIKPEDEKKGVRLHISEIHRISPQAVDPTIKNYHWLDLVRGQYEAYEHGADLALLTDQNGNVVEGSGFNVFVINGTHVSTPGSGVLEGITRKTVIELCPLLDLTVEEREVPAAELVHADEVFITSTAGGIMPINFINEHELSGASNYTCKLRDLYWQAHRDPRFSESVEAVLNSDE